MIGTESTARSAKEASAWSTLVRAAPPCYTGWDLPGIGTDIRTGEQIAMKLTNARNDPRPLEDENETYKALSGGVGIPQVRWFGPECDFYVLVHDLLGPSLEDLLNYCERKFSLKTILLLADQAISRIEYIHSKGFLHRDIKPDNFLMGVGEQGNTLYTVDFGLSKEHWLAEGDRRYNRPFGGTARYASINNHNGFGTYSVIKVTLHLPC